MDTLLSKLSTIDWLQAAETMHQKGFALIPGILDDSQCEALKKNYINDDGYRKTVVMERHQYGLGEYKYFDYPLPPVIQTLRETTYPHLAAIANQWMQALNSGVAFPATHEELLAQCQANGQRKATVLILKYGKGGFNALHQDLYGSVYFPIQVVLFLSEPNSDYTGGEFVLIEQVPRAQSKARVLLPNKGDMLVFTTNFRPAKGKNRYYRVNVKHGVSEVHEGERYTLGIIFHDALS
ncbi:2OG-Fe(II) oxygenase [Parapedobacter koreensis]|uniref:Fe2OG dioxygenase domain-containing protein n=1 Tax=Parapedobacter koreensis TaxID=332977 RepID=A0A1H7JCH6_9SPHI|nr:2OG-Fe(II) oxygenase [Parapedobacter koreensis]SEK72226.1 hypothetical protein SAMN05421740_102516 [Parapedobacter koreensis]